MMNHAPYAVLTLGLEASGYGMRGERGEDQGEELRGIKLSITHPKQGTSSILSTPILYILYTTDTTANICYAIYTLYSQRSAQEDTTYPRTMLPSSGEFDELRRLSGTALLVLLQDNRLTNMASTAFVM